MALSTTEFYAGLRDHFKEWNGMFFLNHQDPQLMGRDDRLFDPDPTVKIFRLTIEETR